jgi:hypothetical protein
VVNKFLIVLNDVERTGLHKRPCKCKQARCNRALKYNIRVVFKYSFFGAMFHPEDTATISTKFGVERGLQ